MKWLGAVALVAILALVLRHWRRERRRSIQARWSYEEPKPARKQTASKISTAQHRLERRFVTRIVGASHRNEDGTSRQNLIESMAGDEQLELRHMTYRGKDALAVCRYGNRQIGWIKANMVPSIMADLGTGWQFGLRVHSIDGGGPGELFGVAIEVRKWK